MNNNNRPHRHSRHPYNSHSGRHSGGHGPSQSHQGQHGHRQHPHSHTHPSQMRVADWLNNVQYVTKDYIQHLNEQTLAASVSAGSVKAKQDRPQVFPPETIPPVAHPVSPPLHINIRAQDGPMLGPNLVNLSPTGFGPGPLDGRAGMEFPTRRSPVQLQHSPPYYGPEDRKSESPSRKRRRMSQSVEMSPSPPPVRTSGPYTRSRGSPPIRRPRYIAHHHYHHSSYQPPHIPLVNVNQVPVSLGMNVGPHPLGIYPPMAAAATPLMPGLPQYSPPYTPMHHHHVSPFPDPINPLNVPPHLHLQSPREVDVDLFGDHRAGLYGHSTHHGPGNSGLSSPPIYFAESRDMMPRRRLPSMGRRMPWWRQNPMPTHTISGNYVLHFLAMFSNPPLSPYSADLNSPNSTEATENYEALLNLAEALGDAKPRGLFRSEIDQLPSYRYNRDSRQTEQTSCVVCMCDFESRQSLRVLPCSHEFHTKCVDKWLKTNRTCPICRGDAGQYLYQSASSPSSSE